MVAHRAQSNVCRDNLVVSMQVRKSPGFLQRRLDLLPHDLRPFQGSKMTVGQLYEYYTDGPNGLRCDMHDCWMVDTHYDVAHFVAEDLIYTQDEWFLLMGIFWSITCIINVLVRGVKMKRQILPVIEKA